MTVVKHTPTPLTSSRTPFEVYNRDHGDMVPFSLNRGNIILAYFYEEEDASHIVKCVNMHDELVEALKAIVARSENGTLGTSKVLDMKSIAVEYLKKAGAL